MKINRNHIRTRNALVAGNNQQTHDHKVAFGRLQGKNLHISLDGNRPVSIVEDAGNQTVYGAMEFQSHGTGGTQYGYDDNGSLIWDANIS